MVATFQARRGKLIERLDFQEFKAALHEGEVVASLDFASLDLCEIVCMLFIYCLAQLVQLVLLTVCIFVFNVRCWSIFFLIEVSR